MTDTGQAAERLRRAYDRLKRVAEGHVGFPECVEAERDFVLVAYETLPALFANPAPGSSDPVREAAQRLLDQVDDLIGESYGVYGLHRNGDGAPWNEITAGGQFERLEAMEDLRAALSGDRHD